MGAGRAARAGQRARLPRRGAGQGHPVRELRPDRGHRLGQRRPITTPARSPSPRSAPGGTDRAGPPTPAPGACWSPPTPAGPTAPGCGCGRPGLATFAAEAGLDITVLHLPPGTSKRDKIEHRLFSAITMNWRGLPLISHEVTIETISAVTTRTGLKVTAVPDNGIYPRASGSRGQGHEGIRGPAPPAPPVPTATGTTPSQQTRPATRHARMKGIYYCASA